MRPWGFDEKGAGGGFHRDVYTFYGGGDMGTPATDLHLLRSRARLRPPGGELSDYQLVNFSNYQYIELSLNQIRKVKNCALGGFGESGGRVDFMGTFTRFCEGCDMAAVATGLHFLSSGGRLHSPAMGNYQIIKLSTFRIIKLSNYQFLKLSNYQIIKSVREKSEKI